ncbi:rhomboid family intramembrane serine protease [Prevotella scopos JCM 17725]|uniref:Membrane associated serine protease, rhomboid family n=1 Tax=Prevotella scopos JCM 17725 TaxID=1236518 RepID=A0AAX2F3Z5_9BACT|nr:rhomboid family intramembrane serine protease [Prevotella scopos]ANR72339.1 rhomboid family intramembrane serine protease [Prevotella scopos JCM 17725]QUB45455.1 rhomboid family intramembrane serine protease [Prevotella scopos JCM 17725]SHF87405.1 Membrane associated serine protease, rhomboid family [Prevotella scopos JCM 17725]
MRNIPVVTKNLLIINILVFIATYVLRGVNIDLNDILGLHFFLAKDFRIWQFFTYMFMHGGFTHILMNMFMLWMFGMVVENVWGPKKFLFYYIVCGLGAGLCQELAQYGTYIVDGLAQYDSVRLGINIVPMDVYLNMMNTVGASGAIYGVLLAFGMLFPNERMFIIPIPIPIKAKWIVMGSILVELFSAIGTSNDGVAHLAHLGGMLFGFILIRYWKKHPYSGYGDFGMNKGHQFFDRMKNSWEQRGGHDNRNTTTGASDSWTNTSHHNTADSKSDWDYNAQKKQQQEEVDRILDKIRKSGYDSLTKDEKQKLFDSSKN